MKIILLWLFNARKNSANLCLSFWVAFFNHHIQNSFLLMLVNYEFHQYNQWFGSNLNEYIYIFVTRCELGYVLYRLILTPAEQ